MAVTDINETKCKGIMPLQRDGFYNFNEEHYTVWLAHEMSKAKSDTGEATQPIQDMWTAFNDRRLHPNWSYGNYDLLSVWSSYIV